MILFFFLHQLRFKKITKKIDITAINLYIPNGNMLFSDIFKKYSTRKLSTKILSIFFKILRPKKPYYYSLHSPILLHIFYYILPSYHKNFTFTRATQFHYIAKIPKKKFLWDLLFYSHYKYSYIAFSTIDSKYFLIYSSKALASSTSSFAFCRIYSFNLLTRCILSTHFS